MGQCLLLNIETRHVYGEGAGGQQLHIHTHIYVRKLRSCGLLSDEWMMHAMASVCVGGRGKEDNMTTV